MADSLKFTIGGQLGPSYRGALSQAVTEAQLTNRRIAAVFSATGAGAMGGASLSGVIREFVVLGREIAMGRGIGRIAGSFTLLLGYLGTFIGHARQGASAAKILAESYATLATTANAGALALSRKAAASAAAFMADASDSAASLDQAVADEAAALAARQHAAAMIAKAEAAEISAAAQGAEAAATGFGLASMLTWAVAAAVVIGVVYERLWGVKRLMAEAAGPATADFKDDYIPLLKRHISDARNEQRALNDEIQKTVEHYFSAAENAKRVAAHTKEHYEHLRKMNEYSNLPQKEKERRELGINAEERQAEIANMATEQANLRIQSDKKLRAAAAIKVKTKEEDARDQAQLNQQAEAAQKYLEDHSKLYQIEKSALSRAQKKALDAAEDGGMDLANRQIRQAHQHQDTMADNDELRRKKAELEKEGNAGIAGAMGMGLSLAELKKTAGQKSADEAAELAAKQAQEKTIGSRKVISSSDWERAGGSMGGPAIQMLTIAKQQLAHLRSIDGKTGHGGHGSEGRGVHF